MPRSRQHGRKGKNKKQAADWGPQHQQQKNEEGYKLSRLTSERFEEYYKGQSIVPESEWDQFLQTLREKLPSTFRITGYKREAAELLRIIKSDYFNTVFTSQPAGSEGSQTETPLQPPKCLSWYPEELAWQINVDKKFIRQSERVKKLHQFLVQETESGNISRQEAVSMIPPLLLDVQPHHKVLDMCAAPGSKTAQLIEMLHADETKPIPEGFVMANDSDNKRCYLMVHQVKRLESPNFLVVNHDASQMPKLFLTDRGSPESITLKFDRILADVPCSGDGTMRKNPDVWQKWKPTNGYNLHGIQTRILERGLALLECGGRLVYSTCSFNPVENEAVIGSTLLKSQGSVELLDVSNKLPDLKSVPGLHSWKLQAQKTSDWYEKWEDVPPPALSFIRKSMFPPSEEEARQLSLHRCVRVLPHHQDTGGFFIAVLQKTKEVPWGSTKQGSHRQSKGRAKETSANLPGKLDETAGETTEQTELTPGETTEQTELTPGETTEQTELTPGETTEQTELTPGETTEQTELTPGETTEQTKLPPGETTEQTELPPGETTDQTELPPGEKTEQTELPPGEKTEQTELSPGELPPGETTEQTKLPPGEKTEQSELPPGEKTEQTELTQLSQGDNRSGGGQKRKETQPSFSNPGSKKRRLGFKEDPFIFLEEADPIWAVTRDFFGLANSFPITQTLVRCSTGKKRNIYFTSPVVKQIVQCNDDRLNVVNLGLKVFSRSESPHVVCDFRLVQEGVGTLFPYIGKRIVSISKSDVITLLTQENPFVERLSSHSKQQLESLDQGGCVFVYQPGESDGPQCHLIICGWKGKVSCRTFMPKNDRAHYLRMCGAELKTKEQILLEKAAARTEREGAPMEDDTSDTPYDDNPENCTASCDGQRAAAEADVP